MFSLPGSPVQRKREQRERRKQSESRGGGAGDNAEPRRGSVGNFESGFSAFIQSGGKPAEKRRSSTSVLGAVKVAELEFEVYNSLLSRLLDATIYCHRGYSFCLTSHFCLLTLEPIINDVLLF